VSQPNTPGKKKSNNLGGLTGSPKIHSLHVRTLRHGRGEEYRQIMLKTLAHYYKGGREHAIIYLQAQRPWLSDYLRETVGSSHLPSSGELLDQILRNRLSYS
jgi:hypothetical protein